MDANTLELRPDPAGRNGTVKLSAYFNGEPVDVEKIDIVKAGKRDAYSKRLHEKLPGIDRSEIDRQLLKIAADRVNPAADSKSSRTTAKSAADLLAEMPDEAKESARQMLESQDLMKRIVDDVAALGVAGEKELVASTYLCGTSRLLAKPLALIAQGPSSSGKSYCIATAARCFPPETVIMATQMTPQALFYAEPGSLSHKLVVVGERSRAENDDTAEATRALREMLSAGRLSKLLPMKINNKMQTELVEQEGPIAYVESTTLTKLFNEDANRCILLSTDERPEQTRRIISSIAAAYSGTTTPADKERIIDRHHALHRMLQPLEAVIPFAERLGEQFATKRIEARRAFPHLLSMIQASALLHQLQRQLDRDGRLLATIDDYQIARRLLAKPFGRQLGGGISDSAARFHDRLKTWAIDTFTTTEATNNEAAENSDRAVRGWLHELHGVGGLELIEPNKGPKPAIWKLIDVDFGDGGASILPKPESLLSE